MQYYNNYNDDLNDSVCGIIKNKLDSYQLNDKSITNNRAIHHDIIYTKNNRVINIKERNNNKIVGVLCMNKNIKYGFNAKGNPYYLFQPLNPKYPNFYVASKNKCKKKIYVVIQFLRWEVSDKHPIGMITDEIGEIDNINNEYQALLYKNNLQYSKTKFTAFKLKNDMKKDLQLQYEKPQYYVFSIDPEGCKDIDDAFHYKETDEFYEIGVHITDITKYITTLDIHKINQCSSIYLPNGIKHLLPELYSEDLCSLIKNRIRNTLSVIFTYEKDYRLRDITLKESIVKVRNNYSYDQVDTLLNYEEETTNLHKFFNTIKNISDEIVDSHTAVEYYMIEANKYVAKRLYETDAQNTILRTHNGEKRNFDIYNPLDKFLQYNGMETAEYQCTEDEAKVNHNILQIKHYTHFTSPIRRLTDIYIHHQLKCLLQNRTFIEIDHNLLNRLNKFQKNMRKLKNDLNKIEVIYDLEDNYETDAYIIDFNNRCLKIFIPELNIIHKTYIYSKKIESLVKTEISKDSITIEERNESTTYKLYQDIRIRLNSLTRENSLQNKLNIKII